MVSLTDNVLKFSLDDTRPLRLSGDLERGEVRETLPAPVHQTFRPITHRRPESLVDAPHGIIGLGHGGTPDIFTIVNSISDKVA
jgi:hypothetical protein